MHPSPHPTHTARVTGPITFVAPDEVERDEPEWDSELAPGAPFAFELEARLPPREGLEADRLAVPATPG